MTGATAVSSASGRALICTNLLDNGGGLDGLRWHVQTAANTPSASPDDTTTTVAAPTTPTTADVIPATTPPTTVAGMPTTGLDTGRWVGGAASLTTLGALLLVAARRRRRRRGFRSA